LVKAHITINKNMVPFDSRSPFKTSGIRVGTAAITTRGIKEDKIPAIVDYIDQVIANIEDENKINEVGARVKEMMSKYPLFAY